MPSAADEASLLSLLSPPGIAALITLASPDSGVGDIDVDAIAAAAAPPTGDTLAPAGIGADEVAAPSPAIGRAGGAVPPPAA